jgi:hypothetical protein
MQRVDGARLAALAARATGIRVREGTFAKKARWPVARLELRRVVAVADGRGESIHRGVAHRRAVESSVFPCRVLREA